MKGADSKLVTNGSEGLGALKAVLSNTDEHWDIITNGGGDGGLIVG